MKKEEKNAKDNILEAAKNVFQTKGMNGARMQEIADKAGINKAMLHYYFRSKQLLFEAVFLNAFKMLAPQLHSILNDDESIENKVRNFTDSYISFLIKHPYLPSFLMQEISRNPDFFKTTFMAKNFPNTDKFKKQVKEEVENGILKPISADQLFTNILSLCLFPIIGSVMLKAFLNVEDKAYNNLMEERKIEVANFIMNSIKK